MKPISFIVEGKVIGKPRPRFAMKGGRATAYTPKRCRDYERKIREAYREAGGERFSGPVFVKVITYRKLPESTPKKVARESDTHKPDIDNVLKIVLDALNGVAFEDDRYVVMASVTKFPRTRIEDESMSVTIGEA